jgi:hypothetical protein
MTRLAWIVVFLLVHSLVDAAVYASNPHIHAATLPQRREAASEAVATPEFGVGGFVVTNVTYSSPGTRHDTPANNSFGSSDIVEPGKNETTDGFGEENSPDNAATDDGDPVGEASASPSASPTSGGHNKVTIAPNGEHSRPSDFLVEDEVEHDVKNETIENEANGTNTISIPENTTEPSLSISPLFLDDYENLHTDSFDSPTHSSICSPSASPGCDQETPSSPAPSKSPISQWDDPRHGIDAIEPPLDTTETDNEANDAVGPTASPTQIPVATRPSNDRNASADSDDNDKMANLAKAIGFVAISGIAFAAVCVMLVHLLNSRRRGADRKGQDPGEEDFEDTEIGIHFERPLYWPGRYTKSGIRGAAPSPPTTNSSFKSNCLGESDHSNMLPEITDDGSTMDHSIPNMSSSHRKSSLCDPGDARPLDNRQRFMAGWAEDYLAANAPNAHDAPGMGTQWPRSGPKRQYSDGSTMRPYSESAFRQYSGGSSVRPYSETSTLRQYSYGSTVRPYSEGSTVRQYSDGTTITGLAPQISFGGCSFGGLVSVADTMGVVSQISLGGCSFGGLVSVPDTFCDDDNTSVSSAPEIMSRGPYPVDKVPARRRRSMPSAILMNADPDVAMAEDLSVSDFTLFRADRTVQNQRDDDDDDHSQSEPVYVNKYLNRTNKTPAGLVESPYAFVADYYRDESFPSNILRH